MFKTRKFVVTKVVTYKPVVMEVYGNGKNSSKAVAITKAYGESFENQITKFKVKRIK